METYLEKKEPWIAIVLSIIIVGAGHIYAGKTTKGIIFIIIDLILYFLAAATGIGLVLAIGFIIFGVIDSYNVVKEGNFQIDQEEMRKSNESSREKSEKEKADKLKQEQEINVNIFAEDLKKCYKLFTADIYSEDEYKSKKDALINNLATKKISCNIEDFLASLISLKEQKILSIEEINKIKILIM